MTKGGSMEVWCVTARETINERIKNKISWISARLLRDSSRRLAVVHLQTPGKIWSFYLVSLFSLWFEFCWTKRILSQILGKNADNYCTGEWNCWQNNLFRSKFIVMEREKWGWWSLMHTISSITCHKLTTLLSTTQSQNRSILLTIFFLQTWQISRNRAQSLQVLWPHWKTTFRMRSKHMRHEPYPPYCH